MGLLRSYLRQFQPKPKPRRYYGQVLNASGEVISRCDCNYRSMTAATRCGRTEAAWLSKHPGANGPAQAVALVEALTDPARRSFLRQGLYQVGVTTGQNWGDPAQ